MSTTVDLDLIRKYNKPGPRYTSYPTAPHFRTPFDAETWSRQIHRNNRTGARPLSLYVHLPFCDTLCWFCACTMMVSRREEPIEAYLATLDREIGHLAPQVHPERDVVQLHFGGGTPTHLNPDQLRRLGASIHNRFRLAPDAEAGCEMDPRGLTREHLRALREIGFNRASLGIQDFDPRVQRAINRVHDEALVGRVIDWIRAEGFASLNLDLIYGLPFQRPDTLSRTLDTILGFAPDRLAVFSYAHVPWIKPHQKLIHETDLPSPEDKLKMLKLVIETLTDNGYVYIGMDHFARRNDELAVAQRNGTLQRNFQGYSTKAGTDIYALGMSAISQLDTAYAQNEKDLHAYQAAVAEGRLPTFRGYVLSEDDRIRRHLIMRLMCDMALDFDRLDRDLAISVRTRFHEELAALGEFEADGLLMRTPDRVEVTDQGRLFIRNIAMTFDAYLQPVDARYSKTI